MPTSPPPDEPIITSLLDSDLYKYTMQAVVARLWRDLPVAYRFKCRSKGVDLRPFAGEIRAQVAAMGDLRFTEEDRAFLRSLGYLPDIYVDGLAFFALQPRHVEVDASGDELEITVRGRWYDTIPWEVPLLAVVSEVYFRRTLSASERKAAWEEGTRRLEAKFALARDEPGEPLALVEFGTRRRFSREWEAFALARAKEIAPAQVVGTSNLFLARRTGLRPFGTMAHEYLQAYQALAPLHRFQRYALDDWMRTYRGRLGIALSDVVGFDNFLKDFDGLYARAYDGCRHDSGDPLAWGEKLIAHYESLGIDPRTKSAVYSDSLTMEKAIALKRHFAGRIRTLFGIGTQWTNDLGVPALNIVLKIIEADGQPVAKLSDSPGKEMSDNEVYLAYLRQVFPPSVGQ